jgi:trehalose 6-phosphate synthase
MDLGYGEGFPDGPDVRRSESPLHVDRQVVLVADESPGTSSSPTAGGARRSSTVIARPGTALETLSDVWVTPGERDAGSGEEERRRMSATDGDERTPDWDQRLVQPADGSVEEYRRFADRVLHPIVHSAMTRVDARPVDWQSYRAFNDRFAAAAGKLAADDSIVWFADHHLALAPALARQHVPDGAFLVHYWSSPWPGWDIFRGCPHAEEIVEGLLGNDLVGFYVPRYGENFLRTVDELLPDATIDRRASRVRYDGSETAVRSFPMGVPFARVQRGAAASAADGVVDRLKDAHGIGRDRSVVLGIDQRPEATGMRHCLRSLEHEWSQSESRRERFTLVLLSPESRAGLDPHGEFTPIQNAVDRINGRFGTADWQPVVRPERRLSRQERYGLYRDADVAIVGSLRSGSSVVTQEFIAAQSEDPGVLLLSDQTGTSDWLGEAALTFTPLDTDSFARQLNEALHLNPNDRHRRMTHLHRRVKGYDDETWIRHVYGTIEGIERRIEREDAS